MQSCEMEKKFNLFPSSDAMAIQVILNKHNLWNE